MSTYLTLTFEVKGPNDGSIDEDRGTITVVGNLVSIEMQATADRLARIVTNRLRALENDVRLLPVKVAMSHSPVYTSTHEDDWHLTGKD